MPLEEIVWHDCNLKPAHIKYLDLCERKACNFQSSLCQSPSIHCFTPDIAVIWLQVSSDHNACFRLLFWFLQVFWTSWRMLCLHMEALCCKELRVKWPLNFSASGCLRYVYALTWQSLNPYKCWYHKYSFIPCSWYWSLQKYSRCIQTIWSGLYVWLDMF